MTEETNKASDADVLATALLASGSVLNAVSDAAIVSDAAGLSVQADELRSVHAAVSALIAERDALRGLLSDTWGNLERMANDEFSECHLGRLEAVQDRIQVTLARTSPGAPK